MARLEVVVTLGQRLTDVLVRLSRIFNCLQGFKGHLADLQAAVGGGDR